MSFAMPVGVDVVPFHPKYLSAFVSMNRDWIERYFELEEMDLAQLENPFGEILDKGGEIFFVVENGEAVGTVSMVPLGDGTAELAKMAVARSARGKGYGDLLMQACVDWAKRTGVHKVVILSNTVLEPAISLYHKHGFPTVHLGDHPEYRRCNIVMERMF